MYPFIRMAKDMIVARSAAPIPFTGTHVSHHICWPWDLDMWAELNNGRTLTLYDLGRLPFFLRTGTIGAMKTQGWGVTVAGSSTRYRRRVRVLDRLEMVTRIAGWDARFFYMDQSMWRGADCASHLLVRAAVTDGNGIVPTARVTEVMGVTDPSPPLPGWITAWIAAEAERPWPPAR